MGAIVGRMVVYDYPAGLVGTITPVSGTVGSVGSVTSPTPSATGSPPSAGTVTPTTHTILNGGLTYLQIRRTLSAPEDITYRANGPDAATFLTPGVAPPGTRILLLSLDGGATAAARMLSGGAQYLDEFPIAIAETGHGIGAALGTTRIGRWVAQQVTLAAVFNGAKGTIVTADKAHVATPGGVIPDLAGWSFIPIGLPGGQQAAALAHTFLLGPSVASTLLDIDANRDTILRAVDTIAQRLGGAVADATLGQYVLDSSDRGPLGGSVTLTLGSKGTTSVLTFDGVSTDHTTPCPILRGTQGQPQTTDMFASCSFTGGDTHHGVPDGGKFTDIVTINHLITDATGDYRSGLPILAHYINRDQGGVYFWPGDGVLHPMSQAMGVTCLWYDESTLTLYAGTDLGVYTLAADPAAYQPKHGKIWTRIGAMAQKVLKIVKDSGTVYALVEFIHGGQRYILQNPASGAAPAWLGGWSAVLWDDGCTDFSVSSGYVYYITQSDPAHVWRRQIGSSTPGTALPLTTGDPATGPVATGLDAITDAADGSTVIGTYVRTSSGASSLFWIAGSGTALLSAGAGLVDDAGNALMVNKISNHDAGTIQWDALPQKGCFVWAATDQGVFLCATQAGNAWKPTMGQSALGDVNVQKVVSGPPRPWLGQMQTHVYALTDATLYYSPDGTVHWEDMFSRQLDVGPLFFALWKQQYGVYPNNVATGSLFSDKPLLYPDPKVGPYNLVRSLDGLGLFDYILYNWQSKAPAGAHKDHTISQISTPALIPEVTASSLLAEAMVRFLALTSGEQEIAVIESRATDTTNPLLTLQPTHLVTVNGPIQQCIAGQYITYKTYTNQAMYVLEHTLTLDAERDPGTVATETRCALILLDDRSDPNKLTADAFYSVDRAQRYRVRGRH